MSTLVTIQNRETGQKKSGNWASLRKFLGYKTPLTIVALKRAIEQKGWDVISGGDITTPTGFTPPVDRTAEAEIDALAQSEKPIQNYAVSNVVPLTPVQDEPEAPEFEDQLTVPEPNPDYIVRELDATIERVLDATFEPGQHETLFLYGGAGAGKTEAVKQYCAKKGLPYTRVSLDETMTIQYLIGRLWFENGAVCFKEGILVKALQQPGVVFLDEANAMLPSKGFILHQLLDSGRIYIPEADKFYEKHPDCKIVLAGNFQNGSYAGVQKMNGALQNRLSPKKVLNLKISDINFKHIKAEEVGRLVKFYADVEAMIENEKSKVIISLRNALRYDRYRGIGLTQREALELSFLDAIEYADPKLAEQVLVNAKGAFGV